MRYIYLAPVSWEQIQNLPAKPPMENPSISPSEQAFTHFDDFCAGEDWLQWSSDLRAGHYENRGSGLKIIKERSVRIACASLSDDFLVCVEARLKTDFVTNKGGTLKYSNWHKTAMASLNSLGLTEFIQR